MRPSGNLPLRERGLFHVAVALATQVPDKLAEAVRQAVADGNDPLELIGAAEAAEQDTPGARARLVQACQEAGIPLPFEARIERLDGFETAVVDTGGNGQPIVLIHSMGLDHRAAQHVVPLLSPTRRVIAFDVRGHGRAGATTKLDAFAAAAADLRQLLDRLGIQKAELVGLSMGGAVAEQFVDDYPDRVSALNLVCTVAKGIPAMDDRAADAERDGLEALAGITLARWLGPDVVAANGWGVRYARECLRVLPVAHWATAWRTLAKFDFEDRLGNIAVPTRVIAGDADISSSVELMKSVCDRIPGAQFHVISGAPHFVSLVKPKGLAEVLLS